MPQKRIPTMTRFLSKVSNHDDPDACWLWMGGKDKDGYGIFWDGTYWPSGRGHYVRVTRWAFEQFLGPLEPGHNVCHTCDTPGCVNPAHFFSGTHKDNHGDREAKGRGGQWKTRGEWQKHHKLTEANVLEIRERYAAGGVSTTALGAEYGVNPATIQFAINRKTWKHI